MTTIEAYQQQLAQCRQLFAQKTRDYSTAWRVLRLPSLTDQLFIKAKRIRSLEENETQKINENAAGEYIALVNYSLMALIQIDLPADTNWELPADEVLALYDRYALTTQELMLAKNHDYGEAWRDMRISSITDLILMKLLRIKQIEDLKGKTIVSEGVDANYQDIINYAIFALIRLAESHN
jgi:hypothetical protein